MEVSNWTKWQTYRSDRSTPPWIKVYRNLLSNPEWAVLSDSEKGQLVSMWMLAADKGGTIPDDPILIQKMCMLDDAPDVNRFATLGFLTPACQPDGNQKVTDCPQVDAPDKTRLDKTRLEEKEKAKPKKRFTPPSQLDVFDYMVEKGCINAQQESEKFYNHYESNGWKVSKNPMKNWKASVSGWLSRRKEFNQNHTEDEQTTRKQKLLEDKYGETATGHLRTESMQSAGDLLERYTK